MADKEPGFAPADLTDARNRYEWNSRYPPGAWAQFIFEGFYILCLLAFIPVALFLFWRGEVQEWLGVSTGQEDTVARLAFAWLGGMLGGTLFAGKWLYHTVAKGTWHRDRFLWRLLTPHLSAGLAFSLLLLVTSGLIGFLDTDYLRQPTVVVGLAILFGYFSDNATAALARLAESILGEPLSQRRSD